MPPNADVNYLDLLNNYTVMQL